nr:hypothetical protein [Tanacetum cinerariifolium]
MDTIIEQQVAMYEALVPNTQRCPFFKAFLVTADVPEIYMQEFWATTNVHHHPLRFKMDNKKHIVNLESFRDMLHICPRIPGQSFDELPFEEEILDFFRFLGHSAIIRTLTDGLYHKRNIDYAFLIWEDFVYQVEQKNHKKSNEMYYPRFTKVIIHHFMSKDPSIPRRNKVNWHYVRDDFMFSTIKVVSRHQNTQQYGAMLPIELTNKEIRNTKAYKEYYAFATGKATPKTKASARRTRSGSDTSITPQTTIATPRPTAAATTLRLTDAAKGKQPAKAPKAKSLSALSEPGGSGTDEGTGSKPGVLDVPTDESEEELSWNSSDNKGANDQGKDIDDDERDEGDESDDKEEDDDEEDEKSFDHIPITPESNEDDGNDEEDQGLKTGKEERLNEEEEADELYQDIDINQGMGIQLSQEIEDSHVTLTPVNPGGVESIFATASTSIAPLPTPTPTMTLSIIASTTTASQAPIPPVAFPSDIIQHLLSSGLLFRFDDRLKALEANFSQFSQTNLFAEAVSTIPGIVHQYMNQQMNKASVNAQLEAEVLTRSSHLSRTSYAVAADLSEMELKKILIEKMEGNKSIQRSDEQRNLYKALVEPYEDDKIILDIYGESVILKRRRDDDDDQGEGPFAGLDRGSKRRREGKEPESASAPLETATRSTGKSTTGSRSRQASASNILNGSLSRKKPPTPDRDWNKTLPAVQGSTQTSISELEKKADSRSSFNELLDTTLDFSNFIMNRLRVNPEGQQYPHNLLQPLSLIPNNRGRRVIPFAHFINNDLEYLRGGASSRKYTTSVTKTKGADYRHIKWIKDLVPKTIWIQEPIDYDKQSFWGVSHYGRKRKQFYGFAVNRESAHDVYSKRRIIAVIDLKIVEWHRYKHLDWITIRRDDDKLYKFKEGDFKRLRLQDIEDMLLLLIQGKLSNLTVEERFAFNVSLRMFTRSIVI